jgi:hypothetical protein
MTCLFRSSFKRMFRRLGDDSFGTGPLPNRLYEGDVVTCGDGRQDEVVDVRFIAPNLGGGQEIRLRSLGVWLNASSVTRYKAPRQFVATLRPEPLPAPTHVPPPPHELSPPPRNHATAHPPACPSCKGHPLSNVIAAKYRCQGCGADRPSEGHFWCTARKYAFFRLHMC